MKPQGERISMPFWSGRRSPSQTSLAFSLFFSLLLSSPWLHKHKDEEEKRRSYTITTLERQRQRQRAVVMASLFFSLSLYSLLSHLLLKRNASVHHSHSTLPLLCPIVVHAHTHTDTALGSSLFRQREKRREKSRSLFVC